MTDKDKIKECCRRGLKTCRLIDKLPQVVVQRNTYVSIILI